MKTNPTCAFAPLREILMKLGGPATNPVFFMFLIPVTLAAHKSLETTWHYLTEKARREKVR